MKVLELSNARKALCALLEEDTDGYTITAAIDHARRVGVESEVRAAGGVNAATARALAALLCHAGCRFLRLRLSSLKSARTSGCCCRI